jgi:hypothetical protein
MEQQGRGNVVGKIARYPKIFTKGGKVELQRVARVHSYFFLGKLVAQTFDNIPIDFHHMKMANRSQQGPRQGAKPRPDLHKGVILLCLDRLQDLGDNASIDEKILAEALAWNMTHIVLRVGGRP